MKNIIEIAGWSGALMILGAYTLNVIEIISPEDLLYLSLNACGAALLGWNVFTKKSYSAFSLEMVWLLVALFGVARLFVF
ncbi:MAG: hypothetical protein ABIH35_04340 [Patescibacteria group bacterium]